MLSLTDTPPPPPCPAPFNLAAYVLAAGEAVPEKIALQIVKPTGAERWSHARLRAAVLGAARLLRDRGLEPGDRVLLRLDNGVEFPIACLGAIGRSDDLPDRTVGLACLGKRRVCGGVCGTRSAVTENQHDILIGDIANFLKL